MALDVDGFAVLAAIARAPEAFPDLSAEAARAARTLVAKQLKARTLPLAGVRRIRDHLGAQTFALILDGLADAEAKALVARLDGWNPEAKAAGAAWHRRRLADLAGGAEPALGPAAPAKAAVAAAPRALGSAAFAAAWDGRDHDAPAAKRKKR